MGVRFANPARILGLPILCWALGCALPCALGSASAAEGTGRATGRVHLVRYTGRYVRDARFARTFGALAGEVEHALGVIRDRLGLVPPHPARIQVSVRDADLARFGADRARCTSRVRGHEDHVAVDLFAEYFLSGDSDLRTVLTHELVHAVMRQCAGWRRYERLPYWVREGLAIEVADEGERHLKRTLLAHEDVDALLTGLMTSERQIVMYPYAWLAVTMLVERGAPTALARLARGLVQGGAVHAWVARLAGMTWAAYRAALKTYARRRVEAYAAGRAALRAARGLYAERRWGEARAAFAVFPKAWPDSAFVPTARYYLARCWFRERRYKQAEAAFEACLHLDVGVSGWVDECHLYLGLARFEQARHGAASATLRDYVAFHPYARERDLGFLALGRALARQGRAREARTAFEAVGHLGAAQTSRKAAAARELRALGSDRE